MKTNSLYIGIMAALALAACNSDDNALPANADERVALQVTSGIETRAYDNKWESDDQIGIFMLNQGNNTVDTYGNVPYVTTDGQGTFWPFDTNPDNEGVIYLPTDGSLRDVIAYYPYQAAMTTEAHTYAINLNDQSDQSAIDFMVAAKVTGKSRTDASVVFNFSHKLSKIKLNIMPGKGLTKEDLKGLTVKITGQHDAATYDVLAGTSPITSGTANATITLLTAADGSEAEGIVLPSTTYDGMVFVFETAGMGSYKWPLNQSMSGNNTFEAGKRYTYTITVNRTDIGVTSTINDWVTGNTENGNAE